MSGPPFDGRSGRLPSAEARRYVYAVLAASLADDITNREGWVLGGVEREVDQRRARKATQLVIAELMRKAAK